MILLGDIKGGIFVWNYPLEEKSKIQRLHGCKNQGLAAEVTCMAMCPCDGSIVGVGYSDGSIILYNWEKDSVVATLESHAGGVHSLAWCSNSPARDFQGEGTMLLASSSGDYIIKVRALRYISSVSVESEELVEIDLDGHSTGKVAANRFWASLVWMQATVSTASTFLIASTFHGKILYWDANKILAKRNLDPDGNLPMSHNRAVFSLHCTQNEHLMYITSIGLDRMSTAWKIPLNSKDGINWSKSKIDSQCVGLGFHPQCMSLTHVDGGRILAIGCGDGSIRVARLKNTQTLIRDEFNTLIWKGIPASVTAIHWNKDSTAIIFGCEDGSVGVTDIAKKGVILCQRRHPSPVCLFFWKKSMDAIENDMEIFSCCLDGIVLRWNLQDILTDLASLQREKSAKSSVQSTKDVPEKAQHNVTETMLRGPISCVGPNERSSVTVGSRVHCNSIMVGYPDGNFEIVSPIDLSILFSSKMTGLVTHYSQMTLISGHSNVIAGLHEDGHLEILRYDAENRVIQQIGSINMTVVFENLKRTAMAILTLPEMILVTVGYESGVLVLLGCNLDSPSIRVLNLLKGHNAPILSLSWEMESEEEVMLISSSQDQSIRLWNFNISQIYTTYAQKGTIEEHVIETIQQSSAPQGTRETELESVQVPKDQTSKALHGMFPSLASIKDQTQDTDKCIIDMIENVLKPDGTVPPTGTRSGLPVSMRSSESFLSVACNDITDFMESQSKGDTTLQLRNSSRRVAALKLWEGDVGGALDILIKNNALSSDFVALAASAGQEAWILASRVYASHLEGQKNINLAVLYLLSIGDVEDACSLYEKHKWYREGAYLASLKLPDCHPLSIRLKKSYASQLTSSGDILEGVALYISIGLYQEAWDGLLKLGKEADHIRSKLRLLLDKKIITDDQIPKQKESHITTCETCETRRIRYTQEQLLTLGENINFELTDGSSGDGKSLLKTLADLRLASP